MRIGRGLIVFKQNIELLGANVYLTSKKEQRTSIHLSIPIVIKEMRYLYLHGLQGNPYGIKYQWFRSCCSQLETLYLPDDFFQQLTILEDSIHESVCLVGNSLGALTALSFANTKPQYVKAMLLCAPPIDVYNNIEITEEEREHLEALTIEDNSIPTYIIGALYDGITIYSKAERLARLANAKYTHFYIVPDEHSLNNSRLILQSVMRTLFASVKENI